MTALAILKILKDNEGVNTTEVLAAIEKECNKALPPSANELNEVFSPPEPTEHLDYYNNFSNRIHIDEYEEGDWYR